MFKKALHTGTRIFVIGLLMSGCALEATEGSSLEQEEQTGTVSSEIANGTYVGYRKGLIEIVRPVGNNRVATCTGALIGPNWGITAAHCFSGAMKASRANIKFTAYYFDPDTDTRRAISDPAEEMLVSAIPTYDGIANPDRFDHQDDIAIFRRADRWINTDESDYLRINGGLNAGSVFDIGKIEAFGRGYYTASGTGSGTLRKMPITIKYAAKHYYYDLEGSRAICRGDSGGPHIGQVGNLDVIAGITTGIETNHDGDLCTRNSGKQWAARTNSRIDWIRSELALYATHCTEYSHYMRCF